jgi:integrase
VRPRFYQVTIKGHLTVLSSVFTYAARHLAYVGANPVTLLDRVERPSSDDEKPKRILNAEELGRLLREVEAPYRVLFDLGAETGARLAEVLGLAWEDVALEGETVTFTHQLDRSGKRQPLKTKRSRRCLEVTPGLIAKLRTHKLASPTGARAPCDPALSTCREARDIARRWRAARRAQRSTRTVLGFRCVTERITRTRRQVRCRYRGALNTHASAGSLRPNCHLRQRNTAANRRDP